MRRCWPFLLLAAFTLACTKWQVAQVGPSLTGESHVRITTAESRLEVRTPVVMGDTLRDKKGIRVPMTEIRKAEVRRPDHVATTALVIGWAGLAVAGAMAYVAWWDAMEEELAKGWSK